MMKIYDVVPKIPIKHIDSPISCTVVVVVVDDVEYLPC